MKVQVDVSPDIRQLTREEFLAAERGVSAGVWAAGEALKAGWRSQVQTALGARLARSIRARKYPGDEPSIGAASLVWTRAPEIIRAHDEGALIRGRNSFWLAIPLPAAGKAARGRRMTPAAFEQKTGLRLRAVPRRAGGLLLVAEGARLTAAGRAAANRRRRRKDGILTGEASVPVFVLVPQVKLTKRLDLERLVRAIGARLPGLVAANWRN